MTASLTPVLTPHGHLLLAQADDAPELPEAVSERLQRAFARGHGHGLLQLGAGEVKLVRRERRVKSLKETGRKVRVSGTHW